MKYPILCAIGLALLLTLVAFDSGTQKEYSKAQNLDFTGAGVTVGIGEALLPNMSHPDLSHTTYYNNHPGTVADDHATSINQ